ncbi:unnamed protein product [Rhizophagus irregularis]|nr:unnamed protein product [Rhizophagus irregularis]
MVTPSCVQPFSIWRSWLVTPFLWEYKTDCLQHPRPSLSVGNALVCATLLHLAKLVGNLRFLMELVLQHPRPSFSVGTPSCVQSFSIWRSWLVTSGFVYHRWRSRLVTQGFSWNWFYNTHDLRFCWYALVCAILLHLAKLVGNFRLCLPPVEKPVGNSRFLMELVLQHPRPSFLLVRPRVCNPSPFGEAGCPSPFGEADTRTSLTSTKFRL